jgi:hypothetical protein
MLAEDVNRCGYREFRPCLNQDPCGTLIAVLVDELATVPTIAPVCCAKISP